MEGANNMSATIGFKNILQPTTLQEAINVIKFLKITHKEEIKKLKQTNLKQSGVIKKLEQNRKQELEFLSQELNKYESDLAERTEAVTKQITEKDEIIKKQEIMIEELNLKLKMCDELKIPEINVSIADSNSDSGIAMENDESLVIVEEIKTDPKTSRKYSRRFADSISFLRRVDFSPIKYKPNSREDIKNKNDKQKNLNVPTKKLNQKYHQKHEKPFSDGDTDLSKENEINKITQLKTQKKIKGSMSYHFSDDGSEDTSEEIFDRVMVRNSVRKSVKTNPKYKKINRSKSKLLEQVKNNIVN